MKQRRLKLGELTSLSFVNRVFCTQEGREKVHTGVLSFNVSHTHTTRLSALPAISSGSPATVVRWL